MYIRPLIFVYILKVFHIKLLSYYNTFSDIQWRYTFNFLYLTINSNQRFNIAEDVVTI